MNLGCIGGFNKSLVETAVSDVEWSPSETGLDHNTSVYVYRGIVGDTGAASGDGDLNSAVHQWINPVAKVIFTMNGTKLSLFNPL